MKTKENYPQAGIGRRSLSFLVLLAIALTYSGASFAQSNTGATAADAKAAAPAQTATMAGETPAAKPGGRGSHDGIKVHGHWTIEVRNPDGTLVSHTEFENALCTTPSSNAQTASPYGDSVIANLLSGNYVTGGWNIQFGNPTIPSPVNQQLACGAQTLPSVQFAIAQSNAGSSPCLGFAGPGLPAVLCSATLSQPTVTSSYPVTLTLSGSLTIPMGTSTTINAVGTFVSTCLSSYTAAQCLTAPAFGGQITGTYLAPPQVATPVTVTGPQTVAVTVQLSFS